MTEQVKKKRERSRDIRLTPTEISQLSYLLERERGMRMFKEEKIYDRIYQKLQNRS